MASLLCLDGGPKGRGWIGVPPRRINEIVHGKRRISADTALRLGRFFGTTDRFWLNLQTASTWRSRRTNSDRGSTRSNLCNRPEIPS